MMTIMTSKRDASCRTRRVSTAQAKATLSELIGAVAFGHERVVIERRGRPVAALVSIDDAESLPAAQGRQPPRGALALVGSWAEVEDDVIDRMLTDIYEARARDLGRDVELDA